MPGTPATPASPSTIAGRPARFVVVGVWNTVFGWGAYWAALQLFGAHYLWATVPAFVLATTNGWYFQRRFVFGTASHAGHSYLKFMAIQTLYYFANLPLLDALVRLAGLRPIVAQVVLTVVIAGLTYVVHDRFTFRPKKL